MEGLAGAVLGGTLTPMREDEDRRAAEKRLVRDAQNGDLQAFERLSAQPTGGEPSTGLGLSIVARYARVLGSALHLDCGDNGRGLRASVSLPRA